jgi:hypothetical protein
MRWFARQAKEWGPLGVSLFAAAIVITIAMTYFAAPVAYEAVDHDPPPPPLGLVDHQERDCRDFHDADASGLICGEFQARGLDVGAEPTASPRPDFYLAARGVRYTFYPSPNWSGRGYHPVQAVVLHVTGKGTCPGMQAWFANPASSVSAHFGVCKDGSVHQYVETGDAAWHAGILNRPDTSQPLIASWVDGRINPNSRTIGIEVLLAPGERLDDYPAQKRSLLLLLAWISETYGVPLDAAHLLGHFQLDAVNRSVDPRCCYEITALVNQPAPPPPPPPEYPYWDGLQWVFETWTYRPDLSEWFSRLDGESEWCCQAEYGGVYNRRLGLWYWTRSTTWTFNPDEGFWRCVEHCLQ